MTAGSVGIALAALAGCDAPGAVLAVFLHEPDNNATSTASVTITASVHRFMNFSLDALLQANYISAFHSACKNVDKSEMLSRSFLAYHEIRFEFV